MNKYMNKYMKSLLLMKWVFVPYFLVILFAAILGKEKSIIMFGNSLFEEYLIIMTFLIIIDIQRIIIKWLTHTH